MEPVNGYCEQNMHYLWIIDIHFSTNYHLSVYDMTYSTLGHTHTVILIVADKDEYNPTKKNIKL